MRIVLIDGQGQYVNMFADESCPCWTPLTASQRLRRRALRRANA